MKPPLALSVIGRDPSGFETRWHGDDPDPAMRPQNLRFSARRGEGFSEGGCTLARRMDRDHFDLRLLNEITVAGAAGRIPWEGRLAGRPGSADAGGHTVTPSFVGWMSHAKSRRFREVFLDRDLGRWGEPSRAHKASWLSIGRHYQGSAVVDPDATAGLPALRLGWVGAWGTSPIPYVDVRYDAGPGVKIGRVYFERDLVNVSAANVNWLFRFLFGDSDAALSGAFNNISGGVDNGVGYFDVSPAARFIQPELMFVNGVAGGADAQEVAVVLKNLALYGTHGLTRRGPDPGGFYLSDIIKNIASRWAPKLNTAGVQENQTIVSQAAYLDPIFPYDAWLELNNLALWELAVWENKTLHYYPADLTDYDWEVRVGDPGVSVNLQGDTIDELCNGVEVSYDDINTGRREHLTPAVFPDLADPDPDNPANIQGEQLWKPLELPFPASQGNALQYGRVKLAEALAPQGIGTIEVEGHVRDRAGHWQPAYMMRPGETVAVMNHPNDRPRLIVESDYDDTTKRMRLAIDSTFQLLEAYFDRTLMAIAAANL